jgi:glycogen synthase
MTADTVGGVWTYAMELGRALGACGVGVSLATMGEVLNAAQRAELERLPNVQLYESSFKLEWMDQPWEDVDQAADWLLDLEQKIQPDLIHLNGYAHGALPWQAPRLIVAHSCVLSWWRAVKNEPAPPEWDRYRAAVAAGLRQADMVIAPSQAMLRALQENYGPITNTRIVHNGRTLPATPHVRKEPLVLAAGRLWDEAKNIGALEAAASALPWPVFVAGEENAPGAGAARRRALQSLGRLSPAELQRWLARTSIYALPARYEPFGLSILEAALSGCALILGDIPSLREIWGEAALYVQPDAPETLRCALLELISHPTRLQHYASLARERAAAYTAERMAQSYLQAYAECLGLSRRGKHAIQNGDTTAPPLAGGVHQKPVQWALPTSNRFSMHAFL